MPKISRQSLINLSAFRQRNGILQKDLADYLAVSRGYISMVESGKSTLAKESIEKIYNNPFRWNVEDLVPAYSRLEQALHYLNGSRNEQRAAEGRPPKMFLLGGDENLEDDIRYGYSGIPEFVVDAWCSEVPELNREWLLTGVGEMLVEDKQEGPSPIELLQNKIDSLEAQLKDCMALIQQLSESLPGKIVDALRLMRNK